MLWQLKKDDNLWSDIQESCSKSLGVSMLLIDNDGLPLSEVSNSCAFCQLIRSQPNARETCLSCNSRAASSCILEKKEYRVYRCSYNMLEIVFPIYVDDRYIGALFIGQLKMLNQEKYERIFASELPHSSEFTSEEFNKQYNKINIISEKRLNDLISFGQALVNIIINLLNAKIKSGEYSADFFENLYSEYSPDSRLVDRAIILLAERMDKLYKLSELALELNCSESALKQQFHRHLKESFSRYYSKMKIAHAKKLLIYTNETTKSISEKLGYARSSNIYKKFKKETGVTMTEFREFSKIHKESN